MVALPRTHGPSRLSDHRHRVLVLGVLLVACIASTAAHYTHNYVEIEHYPGPSWISNDAVRVAIVVSWPVLTTAGLFGYVLYERGRYVAAYPLLAAYSLLGSVTLLHFTSGNPHIPPFWYATIFTDGALGLAILAFAHWSAWMQSPRATAREGTHA
jgi:hypothetical protein